VLHEQPIGGSNHRTNEHPLMDESPSGFWAGLGSIFCEAPRLVRVAVLLHECGVVFRATRHFLQGGIAHSDPAWVCHNHACGYEEISFPSYWDLATRARTAVATRSVR
jgi:hypothetical protein